MGRLTRACLLVILALLSLPGAAASQEQVVFNLEALDAARIAVGATGAGRLVWPDYRSVAVFDATGTTSAGYFLTGTLARYPSSSLGVVVNGDVVAAYANLWGGWAVYSPMGGSGRTTRKLQPATLRPSGNDAVRRERPTAPWVEARPIRPPSDRAASTAPAPMEDGSWIDVLVFYTPETKRDRTGGSARFMAAMVDLLIVAANKTYADSGIVHRLRLAAPSVQAFSDAGRTTFELLDMLRTSKRVRELRNRHAADVVALLVGSSDLKPSPAVACLNRPDRDPAESICPFSVSCPNCVRAFPHEIGHNMGLLHERHDEKKSGTKLRELTYPAGVGFAGPIDHDSDTPCIVTVMAVGRQCVEDGLEQVARFSNPNRLYKDTATGIPGDKPSARVDGPANAARHMNRMRRHVANWRRAPCLRSGSRVRLRASNGQYVVAVGNGGGAVRANQPRRGPRGLFTLVDHNGGPCVASGDTVSLHTSDGFYLRAARGGGGDLDATAPRATPWARFVARRHRGSGAFRAGDEVTLRTQSGNYVVAQSGGGGEVRADAVGGRRPWVRFAVVAP